MAKKPRGLYAGKKLREKHKASLLCRKGELLKRLGIESKYDPLAGAPRAKGIVLKKKNVDRKKPNSGLIKCVVVQLVKNGKTVTAFCPGAGAIKYIDEHNSVIIERIGGPRGGSKGDIPGIKFKVVEVNNTSLKELRKGTKEKPIR